MWPRARLDDSCRRLLATRGAMLTRLNDNVRDRSDKAYRDVPLKTLDWRVLFVREFYIVFDLTL